MSIFFNGDKVELGGRNLLTGTNDGSGWSITDKQGELNASTTFQNEFGIRSNVVFHLWNTSLKPKDIILGSNNPLVLSSGYYTFSFIGKHNGYSYDKCDLSLYSSYTDEHEGKPHGKVILTNEWQTYTMTFSLDQDTTLTKLRLLDYSNVDYPGGSIYIANLQLEKGKIATDYHPNYEDLENKINGLQNQINQLKGK